MQAVAAVPLIAAEPVVAAEPAGLQVTSPAEHFPSVPRRRLSVTSYPFRAYIESPTNGGRNKDLPGMDLTEFPGMIAKRFGVHNINPLGDHLRSTDPDYLKQFRVAIDSAQSHLVDLGLAGRDFSHPSQSVRDEALAFGRRWIDIAATLGSPSVRQHLQSPVRDTVPSVPVTAECLGRLADYGAKRNVVVNLENDAPGAEDPFFIAEVVSKVNHPYLRALPDFGNSIRGHDAPYNYKAVGAMLTHAYNMCHVKAEVKGKEGQVYQMDLPALFALARERSYRGYFSMEFDTATGDPYKGTEALVNETLKCLA